MPTAGLVGRVARHRPAVDARIAAARRAAFVARVRLQAEWVGSTVDLSVERDVRFAPGVRVRITPGTHSTLRIGAGTTVDTGVLFLLKGGSTEVGPWCDLRRNVVLNVSGRLVLEGQNAFGWGTVLHCANSVVFRRQASAGEYVSVIDSSHFQDTSGRTVHENVEMGQIEVGANTLLAVKVTLTRNARIGANSIVGANSVVTSAFPDGCLLSGVPARQVRELTPRELPDPGVTTSR